MSIGTDADGGFEVPIHLDRDLQTVAANYSPLLRLAKNVTGATDGYRANDVRHARCCVATTRVIQR